MKGRFFDILQEVERDHKQGKGSSKDSHLLIMISILNQELIITVVGLML